MLCQSLLPTAAYTVASHDSLLLAQMGRAFGVPDRDAAKQHPAHHHAAGEGQPAHDHGIHCSLCLAHVLDLTLMSFALPALASLPFGRSFYAVFDAGFSPAPWRVIMPRGPPRFSQARQSAR